MAWTVWGQIDEICLQRNLYFSLARKPDQLLWRAHFLEGGENGTQFAWGLGKTAIQAATSATQQARALIDAEKAEE